MKMPERSRALFAIPVAHDLAEGMAFPWQWEKTALESKGYRMVPIPCKPSQPYHKAFNIVNTIISDY